MSSHGNSTVTRRAWFVFAVFVLVIICAFLYSTQRDGVLRFLNGNIGERATVPTGPYYVVTRAVDGDTLLLDYDGVPEKVRLIGINTPETVDPRKPVECFGKEASTRMKELAEGKLVRLERDPTQDTRDIYNRILAYAYLEDGQMLNRKMIAEGYAYEYTYMIPYTYQKEFKELQTLARTSERGLWGASTCNGKK